MARPKLPPFARPLADARRQGLVPELPAGYFLVAFGWTVHRRMSDEDWLPRVVIPLDAAIQDYDYRPLAGLDLMLAFELVDQERVWELEDLLLDIHPRSLSCLGLPPPGGKTSQVVAYKFPREPLNGA